MRIRLEHRELSALGIGEDTEATVARGFGNIQEYMGPQ